MTLAFLIVALCAAVIVFVCLSDPRVITAIKSWVAKWPVVVADAPAEIVTLAKAVIHDLEPAPKPEPVSAAAATPPTAPPTPEPSPPVQPKEPDMSLDTVAQDLQTVGQDVGDLASKAKAYASALVSKAVDAAKADAAKVLADAQAAWDKEKAAMTQEKTDLTDAYNTELAKLKQALAAATAAFTPAPTDPDASQAPAGNGG